MSRRFSTVLQWDGPQSEQKGSSCCPRGRRRGHFYHLQGEQGVHVYELFNREYEISVSCSVNKEGVSVLMVFCQYFIYFRVIDHGQVKVSVPNMMYSCLKFDIKDTFGQLISGILNFLRWKRS